MICSAPNISKISGATKKKIVDKEFKNSYEEQEINDTMQRYEDMLRSGQHRYFDVIQFEYIIDHLTEEGKIFPALQMVEMGLEQHPASMALKTKKAGILLNLGEINNALEMTRELIHIEDTNYELHLMMGSAQLLLGSETEAAQSFNLAIKHAFEERHETLFNIGYAYEQVADYNKAISFFEEVVNQEPGHEEAMYELAFCYEKVGLNEKSIACYDRYLDLEPYSDSAWFNLGILYTKTEELEKSVWAYELALAINEDFPNAWFNMGHSLMMLENFPEAITAFKQFLVYESDNDDILCFIADCYLGLEEDDKATKYYKKSIKINSLNAKAWFGLGLIEKTRANDKQAFIYFRKALKIDEENSIYHYTFALLASDIKRYREATDSFEAACELNPMELDYWLSFAEMLYKRGMVVSSIEILKSAAEFHPENSLINYRLAAYYLETQNEIDATSHLKKALDADYENHHYFYDSYPEAINVESMVNLIKKHKTIDFK
jgi:tetratricopeptide (TPR) repeat protein